MNQVLLRLPPELHHRLKARAQRDGRSVNTVAASLLDAAVDADLGSGGDRRARLVARARQLDVVGQAPPAVTGAADRRELIRRSAGAGSWLLDDLEADRGAR